MSKTFIVKEVRKNEKGQEFVVESKISAESQKALLKFLKEHKPNLLWDGTCAIKECDG